MINRTSSTQGISLLVTDEKTFDKIQDKIVNVNNLIEAESLRDISEETISALLKYVLEIIKEFRAIPAEVLLAYGQSRDAMLEKLRNAYAELNLALDQLLSKGKTARFYKCLLKFQEYFEDIAIQKNNTCIPDPECHVAVEHFLTNKFFISMRVYQNALNVSQEDLQHLCTQFSTDPNIKPDHYQYALTRLHTLSTLLQEQGTLLNEALSTPITTHITTLDYQLMVKLYFADEVVSKLISLIMILSASHRLASKQTKREELLCKLQHLLHIINDISQKMHEIRALRDRIRFEKQSQEAEKNG